MIRLRNKKLDLGWSARLELKFSNSNNRTLLDYRKHHGPLQVQKPFYPEPNGTCHIYILHPPGGVVGGDHLNISINVNPKAHTLITTPAAGKFYRSSGAVARQEQIIKIEPQGIVEWFPSESIIFSGAKAQIKTKVELSCDSHFMGWEILCLGRPASNESFSRGELDQRFEVWREGKPLWIERLKLNGDDNALHAKWGLQGFPVIGNMVCVIDKVELVDEINKISSPMGEQELFSATQTDGIIICYFMGNSVERCRSHLIKVWKILRQNVIQREAVEPRIWAT